MVDLDTRVRNAMRRENAMALQVDLLEESFDQLMVRGDDLVSGFYGRALAVPALAALFAGVAMDVQKLKFLSTLLALRNAWRQLDRIEPELEALGARHLAYGVLPEHYPWLGRALLDAMAEVGGDAWQDRYGASWQDAYTLVQGWMLRGAEAAAAAADSLAPSPLRVSLDAASDAGTPDTPTV